MLWRGFLAASVAVLMGWCLQAAFAADDPLDPGIVKKPDASKKTDKSKLDAEKVDKLLHPEKAKAGKADAAAKTLKKDPVELALALPKNATLRPDQQATYKRLCEDYKPKLQSALDKVQSASGEGEKTLAARDFSRLKVEVQKQIQAVLQAPPPQSDVKQPPKKNNGGGKKHGKKRH